VTEASAILALAHRDFIKLLRDRQRIVADFAFPLIFIGILGTSLQAGFGAQAGGLNLLDYVFTGVLAQTVWQSSALGLISLLADREQDFSQEIFVSPISRYSIILGKILGESVVALPQALGIIAFGFILQIHMGPDQLARMVLALLVIALFGGAWWLLASRLGRSLRAVHDSELSAIADAPRSAPIIALVCALLSIAVVPFCALTSCTRSPGAAQ